jgi:hypothetical protein
MNLEIPTGAKCKRCGSSIDVDVVQEVLESHIRKYSKTQFWCGHCRKALRGKWRWVSPRQERKSHANV